MKKYLMRNNDEKFFLTATNGNRESYRKNKSECSVLRSRYQMIEADVAEYFPQRHNTFDLIISDTILLFLYARLTSPSVQSSMMIQTGLSVITPISFTIWGWSNWRMVTARKELQSSKVKRSANSTIWTKTETLKTYKLLVKTFPWRCLTLNFYMSSQQQTRLDSPTHTK